MKKSKISPRFAPASTKVAGEAGKNQKTKIKLRKGDEVKVVLGKDKGKTGKIDKILLKESKVLILGVNQYKRHMKARSQKQKSEIITITKPLPVSNVQLICPKCHAITRVGFTNEGDKKVRICAKCDQQI